MELESKKYKIRLIIIAIIAIVSVIFGIIAEKETKRKSDELDNEVERLQGVTAEQYEKDLSEKGLTETYKKYGFETKEKALEKMQDTQKEYQRLFGHPEIYVTTLFVLNLCGSMIGVMMYFVFLNLIMKKIWPDVKKWLIIVFGILSLIILIFPLFYILIPLGIFGQLPFIIYTLYKYIKTKKTEDKGDIIVEKQ